MKKNWLPIIEVGIAAVGLIGWMLSDNVWVAAIAASLIFAFGVFKPLIESRRSARSAKVVDQQYDRAESQLEEQIIPIREKLALPTLPAWSVVQSLNGKTTDEELSRQQQIYCNLVRQVQSERQPEFVDLKTFGWLSPNAIQQINGVIAFRRGEFADAAVLFKANTSSNPDWTEAWFGWLTSEYALGNRELVAENIPYLNGVELSPYAPLNEEQFCQMTESEREQMTANFQISMEGIGDLYSMAMLENSREDLARTRAELRAA